MTDRTALVALVVRERQERAAHDRLARLAACIRACCEPSFLARVTRAFRSTAPTALATACEETAR